MSALLKKSWKDLSRRRARTIFTIITVALGVMGIGLFAITPLADRAVQAELKAEKMHNIGVRVTDVPLTAQQLNDLKSLDNVDQMSPQAELPVTIEIGGRRERALLVGIPDYADQAVDVVRITSGEVPRGMQVLTDQGNEANAVISLSEGDDITVQDPTGTTNRLLVTGVGKNFIHSGATRGGVAVFYTSLDAIEQISGRTGFTNLNFTLKDTDPAAMAKTVEVIRDYLVANTSVVAFDNLADVREEGFWEGREIFSQIMNFMAILAFMILFVSLFLIANTMNTMVSEQTREIAMMKAIGATRATVFRSFLTTSALIGFIGAGIGAGLGIVVASLVERTFMKQSFGFDAGFDVNWPTVGISLAVGVGVVVLASLPAIFRTLRVSVVEGLESHGISADYGRTFLDRSLMGVRGMPPTVQMGIRNASRRKGRSISTILQVAFAVAVVLTMLNGGRRAHRHDGPRLRRPDLGPVDDRGRQPGQPDDRRQGRPHRGHRWGEIGRAGLPHRRQDQRPHRAPLRVRAEHTGARLRQDAAGERPGTLVDSGRSQGSQTCCGHRRRTVPIREHRTG